MNRPVFVVFKHKPKNHFIGIISSISSNVPSVSQCWNGTDPPTMDCTSPREKGSHGKANILYCFTTRLQGTGAQEAWEGEKRKPYCCFHTKYSMNITKLNQTWLQWPVFSQHGMKCLLAQRSVTKKQKEQRGVEVTPGISAAYWNSGSGTAWLRGPLGWGALSHHQLDPAGLPGGWWLSTG